MRTRIRGRDRKRQNGETCMLDISLSHDCQTFLALALPSRPLVYPLTPWLVSCISSITPEQSTPTEVIRMHTDRDPIEPIRNQILDKIREKEAEIRELRELARVLLDAPKVLAGQTIQSRQTEPSTRYNMTFAKDIDEYLASYPCETSINIKGMLETLKKEKGLHGKDKSLYAYAHSILREKANKGQLSYRKGMGFYKTRDETETN
jgi:hypothetical protein